MCMSAVKPESESALISITVQLRIAPIHLAKVTALTSPRRNFIMKTRLFHLFTAWILLSALAGGLSAPPVLAQEKQSSELSTSHSRTLQFNARSRVETSPGSGEFAVIQRPLEWDPKKTAIVVCDMWDQHWCQGATRRVAEMAPRMNEVIKSARAKGVFIIHAPSGTLDFYKETPQRKLAQAAPVATPKVPLKNWCSLDPEREGPLPIDDSDGGCDDWPACKQGAPWKRQIDTIEIMEGDAITDSSEAYNLLQQRGIDNVIVMGVHVNMCVLGRPFSIRQMVYQGKNVVLMRDMTDAMYNSRMPPYASHFRGNELVVEHIEAYWSPSITSAEFVGGEPFRFKEDVRPRVLFMIGEPEYDTHRTLPRFGQTELEPRGFQCTYVQVNPNDPNDFPGLESLESADLLVLSVRRRTPPKAQLDLIRKHVAAGKPLVTIRTSSHAFDANPPSPEHAAWPDFDVAVLGAKYQGHYSNKPPKDPPTVITLEPQSRAHPILTGLPADGFQSTSHLYRIRDLAPSATALLRGSIGDGSENEPVAWIETSRHGRIFSTSLGDADDFTQPEFKRLLLNGILWSLHQPIPPAAPDEAANRDNLEPPVAATDGPEFGPLTPAESMQRFKIAEDLEIEQVLAEPIVRQPVFFNFDERGRMWVVQYLQYPSPAGLTLMSKDQYWRAVYDKIPPPPPNHFVGRDKITIHEDTNGDGQFDKHATFVDGLNIVTAVAQGRGGVWVLNPPYLLFYADRNQDDIPDGDPEVHLAGFGLEDTHAVVNSLCWGPDGWLYAAQGSTVTGNVIRPGLDTDPVQTMGQLIWRYHPETKRYEIFAEGGGNAFGVELDSQGRLFSGHNGGNTRGFHYVQGGYYQKGFSKHGPLSNPYAFGYFPAMAHPNAQRFTHTFVIYDGGALPEFYHGKLFGVEPLQGRIVLSRVEPDRSSFKTTDLSHPVTTTDAWFRPVDIKTGPDGAIYIADWHDSQVNHYRNHEGQIDDSNGRIYRLKGKGTTATRPLRLDNRPAKELAGFLSHENKWVRQTALRLLGDRQDPGVLSELIRLLETQTDQLALESLWAIYVGGGFNETLALRTLEHPNPQVRLWTIRLLGDDPDSISSALARKLERISAQEPDLEVRGQLAATAKRLPAGQSFPLIRNLLAHETDTQDIHIPLLLWWALEAKADSDRDAVLELFEDSKFWTLPLVRDHILHRVMRRYAMAGARRDLLACASLLNRAPGPAERERLLAGFEEAFKGRTLAGLPDELVDALARQGSGSLILQLRQGNLGAAQAALEKIQSPEISADEKIRYIQIFGEVRQPKSVPILLDLVRDTKDAPLRKAALNALQIYDQPEIGLEVAALYPQWNQDLRLAAQSLLASRGSWAVQFLKTVDQGKIRKEQVPPEFIRMIQLYSDPAIADWIKKNWQTAGPPQTDFDHEIERLNSLIRSGIGDPYSGKKLYAAACAACHILFDQGGHIGPDLTPYQRDDLDNLLLGIVNPNAEIREGFESYTITTKDDRALSGFLADQDNRVVVLRGLDGQNQVIPRNSIEEMIPAGTSLMPEGLLDGFNEGQIRDLFAYLRSTQPLND
jgi:putative membrane-bound dehydrogenase-like protein